MSKTKTNAELLKAVRQDNKTAREKRAVLLGWNTSSDLILYLTAEVSKGNQNVEYDANAPIGVKAVTYSSKKITKKSKKSIPTIHAVEILDASGSMSGEKFKNALYGINNGVFQLKNDTAKVNYTYTLCDFSSDILFKFVKVPLDVITGTIKGETRGSTALFDAIGETIAQVKPGINPGDKVLVNIYTDGQENCSRKYSARMIDAHIKELSTQGWTFTFIGTPEDVKYAQSVLSIDKSNTLVYDGTAAGLEKAFTVNSVSRSAYSAKVEAGEDVSVGFYKDIK